MKNKIKVITFVSPGKYTITYRDKVSNVKIPKESTKPKS